MLKNNKIMAALLAMIFLAWMQFALASDAQQDTKIGVGDVVRVLVYDHPDLMIESEVNDQGMINYPLIGLVKVLNLTTKEVEQILQDRYKNEGYLKNPHVNASITHFFSRSASILGEVNRPGQYKLDKIYTLTDLLAAAAGVSVNGGDMLIHVRQVDGKPVKTEISVEKLFRSADLSLNVPLQNGDVVFVTKPTVFYIYGEVTRTGAFRLEKNMTVTQALVLGGGLTPRGTLKGITIKRQAADGSVVEKKVGLDDFVQPNDVLLLKESWF